MNREYIPQGILLRCWTSPGGICCYLYLWICAILTLSTRCSSNTLRYCILPGEMCCCLYLRICAVSTQTMKCTIEFAVLYKCWKNYWMNPHVSALFVIVLTEKWTGFSKKYFLRKRLFKIFFSIHTTPLFWVVSTSTFVCWRHIREQPSVF